MGTLIVLHFDKSIIEVMIQLNSQSKNKGKGGHGIDSGILKMGGKSKIAELLIIKMGS